MGRRRLENKVKRYQPQIVAVLEIAPIERRLHERQPFLENRKSYWQMPQSASAQSQGRTPTISLPIWPNTSSNCVT